MSQDNTAGMLTVEEALAKNDLTPEVRKMLEKAHKQEVLVRRNKKEDLVRVWNNYKKAERQKIFEEAEKDNFLLFIKVIENPKSKVRRLIYPDNKIIIMSSSIPDKLETLNPGTFLFINEDSRWKLFLILKKNKETELKELNISHIEELDIELELQSIVVYETNSLGGNLFIH